MYMLCDIFSLCEFELNDEHNDIEKRVPQKVIETGVIAIGVIVIGIFVIFLVFCYLIALCVNRKAMNDVILSIPWTLWDFVLQALFIKNQVNKVHSLYMPSIVFFIGPVIVNIILSLVIIINEKKKGSTEFKRWFHANSSLAATATVIAGADMSAFKVLYSHIFGLKRFNAPFSDDSKTIILWGCVISSIIQDIPQFVIQILYKTEVEGGYDLIPFLKLVSTSVKLPIGIIGRVYEALKDHRKPSDDDDNNNNNDNNNSDMEK
ncbi:hypothetical protein RclHR1_15450002 [Rhizophagus clarus]|uniref:Uncharacterized protein n=1 Tax=Rhizophagus clarus TaxID=94130 RepID=A0A2Z6QF52_9GLOM|nr:hypothetical protein RclHR1_15450002 [Rhizophagus clarus]